jgi:hypothetical protein
VTPPLEGIRRTCACGRLLCIQLGRMLHVKHGPTWWVVDGTMQVTCGRCRRSTTLGAAAHASDASGGAR